MVYQSILGDYSLPSIWEWTVSGVNQPQSVQVSVDGGSEIELPATARSYRPNIDQSIGTHILVVTATFSTFFGPQARGSATATVANVDQLPAFSAPPGTPNDLSVDTACG